MTVNIHLPNAIVYDVERFDVMLGESFRLEVIDAPDQVRWFADQDPVLSISVAPSGHEAAVIAAQAGVSEIQLQNAAGAVVKKLNVTIYTTEASRLSITHADPVSK